MSERRQLKRYAAQVSVWCEHDEFTLYLHTLNISREGMFVRTATPLPLGAAFTIVMEEPDVAARVRVSWVRDTGSSAYAGMGLSIVGFERGEKAYQRFVQQHGTDPGLWLPGIPGGRVPLPDP